jgi:hypothetical protein
MRTTRGFRYVLAAALALGGCNALLDVKDIYLAADGPDGAAGADGGDGQAIVDAARSDGGEAGPCSTDLMTDALNCGRCGHDCVGGKCMAGQCRPVTLASGLSNPNGIALGGTDVYVTTYSSNAVLTVPKAGGAVAVLATNQTAAMGVALDNDTLYWANNDFAFNDAGYLGGVWKCTLPACATRTLVRPADYGSYPVIRSGTLFYNAVNVGEIDRSALDGTGQIALATNVNQPFAFAVDDTHLYFTSIEASLNRVLIDGGNANNPQAIGASDAPVGFVTLDDTRVYWAYTTAQKVSHVSSAPKDGGGDEIEYGAPVDNVVPLGVAVDATYLYWSTAGVYDAMGVPAGDGKVFACPKAGCAGAPALLLASANSGAGPMAQDDKAVYWVEYGEYTKPNGRVCKVAKP